MGSGLIYALVIGLWALVLLPTWLRNHEQVDESKQVDKFRRAMTELSKSRVDVLENSTHRQVQVKHAVRAGLEPTPRLSAAERRRRVLAGLTGLQLIGVLARMLGADVYVVALPAMLIVTFLTLARTQVRTERARRAAEQGEPLSAVAPNTFTRTLAVARAVRRSATAAADSVERAPAVPTVGAPASWQPVRTPAPSYVHAPAATAVPRAIDAAGGWTGSAMVSAAHAARAEEHQAAQAMAEQGPVFQTLGEPIVAHKDADTAEIPVIRITA
ncbi:MAG: hypothetical protein ACYC3W_03770 [Candidatus Nanopelagicales bacterium]